MAGKNGPGRRKKKHSSKRNSPLRPKTGRKVATGPGVKSRERVATLKTTIENTRVSSGVENTTAEADETSRMGEHSHDTSKLNKKQKGVRLQKLLADRGYGSRRKMEGWIKQGKVEVNGQAAQLGQRVSYRDTVRVNGYALREKAKLSSTKVLMYNKPEGEICTMNDPRRRPTVFRRLPKLRGARWVVVGRLDINTTGLLLFTTNGELANKLMHPSSGIEREYRCRVFGQIDKNIVQQLLDGIQIDHHTMKFDRVVVMDMEGETRNKWVHVTLAEGRNREVRKLWEAVGCQVSRLTRIRYGSVSLPRNLKQGQYRELSSKEVRAFS